MADLVDRLEIVFDRQTSHGDAFSEAGMPATIVPQNSHARPGIASLLWAFSCVGRCTPGAVLRMMAAMKLNERAAKICDQLTSEAARLRIAVHRTADATVLDLGIETLGGLEAGVKLAEACMGGLGTVSLVPSTIPDIAGPAVTVFSDQPIWACMAAQYAGWEVKGDGYFAMGSGPMRACAVREKFFERFGISEASTVAVGISKRVNFRQPRWSKILRSLAASRLRNSRCSSRRRRASPARCKSWLAASRQRCTSCSSSTSI